MLIKMEENFEVIELNRLEGKIAVITGGAQGIGREMCELFISEGAEAVYSVDIKKGNYAAANVKHIELNVTDTIQIKRLVEDIREVHGRVDILINNAGITRDALIAKMDEASWDSVIEINLKGVFNMTQAFAPLMIEHGKGSIINISSVNGDRPFCGASYTSSKGAINTLTKNVAMRLIDTNIRINAVAPGATVTPAHLANKAGEQPGGAKMLEYSKHFVYFPGPECDPIDQANACLFLASDMGKHVKGQVIQVCNGAFL